MDVLDLFSGIGGFSLGLNRAGYTTVAFCEIDPFCRSVLKKNWPTTPIHNDITELNGRMYAGVDVVCGGFPCQPYSGLGHKKGFEDERDLWPEMLRVITESKPRWVIGENVDRFLSVGWDRTKTDLEKAGYEVGPPFVLPSITKADHRRNRAWFVAYSYSESVPKTYKTAFSEQVEWDTRMGFAGQVRSIISRDDWQADQPSICGVDDGVSHRMDKYRRHALGNAVVPYIPEIIGLTIKNLTEQ